MTSSARHYSFGPVAEGVVLLGLRAGQIVVIAAGMVAAVILLYAAPSGAAAALTFADVLATLGIAFAPIHGRTVEQWTPVLLAWARRRGRGGLHYRSGGPTAGARVEVEPGAQAQPAPALPETLVDLDLLAVPIGPGEIGVIHDRKRDTFTGAIVAKVGSFGLLEGGEQERRLMTYGSVLASASRESSPVRRIQWVERTVPSDGDTLAAYLQGDRDAAVPMTSSPVKSYIELIEHAGDVTREHEILVALQIDARKGWRAVKRHGGGVEGACEVLRRELQALASRLSQADVHVAGGLTPRQYAAAIRHAFDPYGRRARERLARLDNGGAGVDPAQMGPIAADTRWDTYRTDSALHRTHWISGWPRIEVGPSFLAPLLMQSDVLRTVSVTMEPIPPATAIRRAEAETTREEADVDTKASKGFRLTARTRQRLAAARGREDELAAGHAELRFAGFVTVSAPDVEGLRTDCDDVLHAAQLARLELDPLYGEQDVGFTFSLPLCRGLR